MDFFLLLSLVPWAYLTSNPNDEVQIQTDWALNGMKPIVCAFVCVNFSGLIRYFSFFISRECCNSLNVLLDFRITVSTGNA